FQCSDKAVNLNHELPPSFPSRFLHMSAMPDLRIYSNSPRSIPTLSASCFAPSPRSPASTGTSVGGLHGEPSVTAPSPFLSLPESNHKGLRRPAVLLMLVEPTGMKSGSSARASYSD